MGYTFCWSYRSGIKPETPYGEEIEQLEVIRDKFRKAALEIQKALAFVETKGIIVCGGHGLGDPVVNDTELWFNGLGDDGCESFGVHWCTFEDEFCKTERRPYELLVGLSLLILQKHLGKKRFIFSSDARDAEDRNREWAEIFEAYKQLTGKEAPRFK